MTARLTRLLPGFPAVLLMPAILALWAALCSLEREGPPISGSWGVPLIFLGWKEISPYHWTYAGFQLTPFIVDLIFALAAGWLVALGVDRLILSHVRPAGND